jgi:hypothetical protein
VEFCNLPQAGTDFISDLDQKNKWSAQDESDLEKSLMQQTIN